MQNLEVAYLFYRARYFYPILIISFSVAAIMTHIITLSQQHSKILALVNQRCLIPVVQDKWVRAISSHRLVPGDVVVLQRGKAMFDMVLLRGACLVNEAMLSGEVTVMSLRFAMLADRITSMCHAVLL